MNRSLVRLTAYLQIGMTLLIATGCAPTQPFFLNESPDLQYYLNSATQIEYPDVDVQSLAETTEAQTPLTIGNHDYEFWDLSLEECVSIALQNSKILMTTSGIAEARQNVADQLISGTAEQFGSVYDVAIQQSTTQSVPLTVDGNGNRVLPRGVLRANQVGGVEDALAEFDAQASAFFSYNTTDRPRNVGDSLVTVTQQQAQDATQQAAISKRFATGGVATLRQQVIYGRNNSPIGAASRILASDWTALIEAQVQHPLMRNRGTLVNRIPVILASLNEDISIAQFEAQVRNLVRDVENAYWDLYVNYRVVGTSIIGRNSAQATAQFARLALENGTGTQQELAQATGQYFQFRGQLESNLAGSNLPGSDRRGVYGAERELRFLMGLSPTDGRLIRPVDEPTIARVENQWEESVCQSLYLNAEIRQNRIRLKQLENELILAKNQVLPEVNVSLLYRWVGVGDTLGPPQRRDQRFPAEGSSALGELTGGDYQEGAIRLEITPPALGMRRELARVNGARLRLRQAKEFIRESERALVLKLSDAFAKTDAHYKLVQTNAQQWQAAEAEVEARLAEFKVGRSPVNVVLQSQQRRAQAQEGYYRALGEYNKSINYIDYLKGTLLANSGINIAEGPWNKKAYWDALERARERSAGRELQYGVSRPSVQRRGPLGNAQSAVGPNGTGVNSIGQTLPPEGGEPTLADPMGAGLEPLSEVPDVPERSLGEATGESMQEFLDEPTVVDPAPVPVPESAPPAVPIPDVAPNSGAQFETMNYQQPQSGYAPTPVRRKPLPHP